MRFALELMGKGDSGKSDVSANVKNYLDDGLVAKLDRPAAKKTVHPLSRKSKPAA